MFIVVGLRYKIRENLINLDFPLLDQTSSLGCFFFPLFPIQVRIQTV